MKNQAYCAGGCIYRHDLGAVRGRDAFALRREDTQQRIFRFPTFEDRKGNIQDSCLLTRTILALI